MTAPQKPLTIVAYSADPWESVLPVVRYASPARKLGMIVVPGKLDAEINPDKVSTADIVLIQRDFPRFFEACVEIFENSQRLKKPILYEVDDLIFELPAWQKVSWQDLSICLHPILWVATEAEAIVAPTSPLCDYLRPLNPNIFLLPNYLDDELWSFKRVEQGELDERVVIGYMAGQTHHADLSSVLPVLERLLQHYSGKIVLRFWGGKPPKELLEHPAVEWISLDISNYAEFARYFNTQRCHILIAPLEDNPFNRCKSGLKFLEYSTLGAPGIFSRLPPYEEIVKHGENGFLATDQKEWEHWLSFLIENAEARAKIASAAQDTVRKEWLLSNHAAAWETTYRQAILLAANPDPERAQRLRMISQVVTQVQNYFNEQSSSFQHEITARQAEKEALEKQLEDIYQSHSWQLVSKINWLRSRFSQRAIRG